MPKQKIATERLDARVSPDLMREIEAYQAQEMIATRTGAALELIRLGLRSVKERAN